MALVNCKHIAECNDNSEKCRTCKNNIVRNYKPSFYEKANDMLLYANKQAEMVGNAEQGGYECPVCGHLTSPYSFGKEKKCEACGNILNIIGCK